MAINFYEETKTQKEGGEEKTKGIDIFKPLSYNKGKIDFGFAMDSLWKKNNESTLKYAGDSAKESVNKGLLDAKDYMKDADKGTDYTKVQDASVKRALAIDANNKELTDSAVNELIGHLSAQNKEPYLAKARPLGEFVNAKDLFDYKRNNYTTTKNTTNKFDSNVQNLQRELNAKGYTDKFGNPLKEDGIMSGKTAYAYDTYVADNPQPQSQRFGNRATMPARSTRSREDNIDKAKVIEVKETKNTEGKDQNDNTSLGIFTFIYKANYPDFKYIQESYDKDTADKALKYAVDSYKEARKYTTINNLNGDAENEADAYRHFVWNVYLTRNMNKEKAAYITNLHEYLEIYGNGWLEKGDIKSDDFVFCKMNQSMLMDLWNNSVARTMSNSKENNEKSTDNLFKDALENKWIIKDVNDVYEFLGIRDCADIYSYTVNTKWDLKTGNITVYDNNGNEFVTLKMGV